MQEPKKMKHRKWHKGRIRTKAVRNKDISFGEFGLKALSAAWVTARQIEAARRVMTRFTKRTGKIWIRVFPHKPVTKKSAEIPMGKGKGSVDHYVSVVKAGTILFEIDGVPREMARQAMELAGHKLPVKTQFISKK